MYWQEALRPSSVEANCQELAGNANRSLPRSALIDISLEAFKVPVAGSDATTPNFPTSISSKQQNPTTMVKPLSFKGDKKVKKRKRTEGGDSAAPDDESKTQKQLKRADEGAADDDANTEHDDSWVSADTVNDVSGPVMFVLPTEPPTALACDAVGKVFTIQIENIVDGNPLSAEPHDVRQVWVANKIAENTPNLSQLRYLGREELGLGT